MRVLNNFQFGFNNSLGHQKHDNPIAFSVSQKKNIFSGSNVLLW